MAFPSVPTKEGIKQHEMVLKQGSTVLGQVQSFSPNESIRITEETRISDTAIYKARDNKDSRCSITLYLQDDMSEFAVLMGGSTLPTAGGWLGTETLKLDPDASSFALTIEAYNSQSVGSLVWSATIDDFAPISNQFTVGNNQGNIVTTIEGIADFIEIYPSTGVGA